MVEQQTPNLPVVGSSPSWPAIKFVCVWSLCKVKKMKNLTNFFGEVRVELSKVVWPARSEFLGAVVVVLITMVAFAIFLGIINYIFYAGILRWFQFFVFGR